MHRYQTWKLNSARSIICQAGGRWGGNKCRSIDRANEREREREREGEREGGGRRQGAHGVSTHIIKRPHEYANEHLGLT